MPNSIRIKESLSGKVDIWLAVPEPDIQPSISAKYEELLDEQETETYRRFRFDRDRHLYLTAHVLLRKILSMYADVLPQEWRFCKNKFGKPSIAKDHNTLLKFNLSHTHGLTACAVSCSAELGIDVENCERIKEPLQMASGILTPNEMNQLSAMSPNVQQKHFTQIWTLKVTVHS